MDGLLIYDYLNEKGNLIREAWNMFLYIKTYQIGIGGMDTPDRRRQRFMLQWVSLEHLKSRHS